MAIFEIQSPDGKTYEVDAPDQNAAIQAMGSFSGSGVTAASDQTAVNPWDVRGPDGVPGSGQQTTVPAAPMGALGTIGDIAASAVSGLARGTADLIGLPGTIGDAAQTGLGFLLRKGYQGVTGSDPAPGSFFEGNPLPASPVSGQGIRGVISSATGGATDYKAQTTPGKYAGTVGEFVPGAIAFGGASPTAILANAVAPGLASEGAGQLTEGTSLEPYARVAGALLGGAAGNIAANRMGATPTLPTAAEIKQSAGYTDLKPIMQEARVGKSEWQRIVDGLKAQADDFGMTTQQKGEFNGIITDFSKRGAKDGGSFYDLEILRRSLANAGQDVTKPANQALSGKLVDHLDNAVDSITGAGQVASSGQTIDQVKDALNLARETYRTGSKADLIEGAIAKAQNQASGVENGLRIQFRKMLDNPKIARKFTDIEKSAMQDVVKGDFTTNAMRWLGTFGVPIDQGRNAVGSLMGGGVGGTIGSAIAGTPGAAIGGIVVPALGTAAKMGASRATQNAASVAEALVKAGPAASSVYNQALQISDQATRSAVLRNLLQGSSAYQAGGR